MTDEGKRKFLAETEIIDPLPGDQVMLTHGAKTRVEGNVWAPDVPRLRLFIHPPNESPDLSTVNPNVPWVEVEVQNNHFAAESVGIARGNLAGDVINRLSVWRFLEEQWQFDTYIDFLGQCASEETVVVSAKHCVLFTWAVPDYSGPAIPVNPNPESGPDFIPIRIKVPDGQTQVTISVSDELWSHGPTATTNANGKGRDVATYAEYQQDPKYRAQNIPLPQAKLNQLVVLWQNDPESPGIVRHLGVGEHTIAVEAENLFFGLHDEYEWGNNFGHVTVALRWS
jgi:hypothetical protein